MSSIRHLVFTIGHSNHPVDRFVSLLRQHGVSAVADVRSAPYSRYHVQYNKSELSRELRSRGIAYVFLGDQLGGRPSDEACYEHGRVRYDRVAAMETFVRGLERLLRGAERFRVAIMCAEKDPLECHRGLLVARELDRRGVEVRHILADGTLETQKQAIQRLLAIHGLQSTELFRSEEEIVDDAIARQAAKLAYVAENLGDSAPKETL